MSDDISRVASVTEIDCTDMVKPPEGHQLIPSTELKGEALAWAACSLWRVHAAILEGRVHVELPSGEWMPFDAEAMVRSLIAGHVPAVLVPDEIAAAMRAH